MSNLTPSVVALDSGLNLQTAKIIAPPGSVLDTLNYEQVDFQGQKRIDGYARYDGNLLPALDEYYVVEVESAPSWTPGQVVTTTDANVIGVVLNVTGVNVALAIIDYNRIPEEGDELYVYESGTGPTSVAVAVSTTVGAETGVTVEEHYQNLLSYTAVLRGTVENLPGGIIGLHWFNDRLYAVADVTTIFISGTSPQIFPNDVMGIVVDSQPVTARVLDSYVADSVRVVFLESLNTTDWYEEGIEVFRIVGEAGTSMGFTATGSSFDIPVNAVASFFESRTEQQAIDEDGTTPDYGWRLKHQGWLVNFQNGNSLFGSLPSTNQNIEGIGVQGPTSTTGNNGRPLALLQKVSITNGQTQVNGWKSTQTPTSYLLDPDDLTDIDSDSVYADGYISWDGTSGTVTALGAQSGTLVEYAATATVEVVI